MTQYLFSLDDTRRYIVYGGLLIVIEEGLKVEAFIQVLDFLDFLFIQLQPWLLKQ